MKKKIARYNDILDSEKRTSAVSSFRIGILVIIAVVCFILILYRLVMLQVVNHAYYKNRSDENIENRHILSAKRGTIFDRRGRALAKDAIQYSVAVSKNQIQNQAKLIQTIEKVTNLSKSVIQQKLKKKSNFVIIARKISPKKLEMIKDLNEPGLVLEEKFLRIYPFGKNAAHVIGFCDVDNKPLGGIEYQYNKYLQGKPGWKIYQRDALGNQLPNLDFTGQEPIDGFDIVTSLDMDFQTILEDELKSASERAKAVEAVAVLMDPNSGEILALANYPQFDSNEASNFSLLARKNRAVSDVYEPGSTFKIVLLAAAIERLNINIDKDIYFCENGTYNLFSHKVLDHKKYGWLTPRRIIENSSNIGTMKIAGDLKPELMYKYIRNLGFGMITGLDLPGESSGILHPLNKFSKTTHYYLSIGYEIGVTPIQLINAYAAIANGGKLYTPYLMKQILGPNNTIIRSNSPLLIRRVLAPETASRMQDILYGVVEEGTGRAASIEGVHIAGKTGTAQLYDPKTKSYDRTKHLASFVGFFPLEKPRYVLLIMIRQPKGEFYGGLVAAPAFKKMAQRILSIDPPQGIEYTQLSFESNVLSSENLPQVENLEVELASNILDASGIRYEFRGNGPFVIRQEEIRENERIEKVILHLGKPIGNNISVMPSLTGLSLKEALNTLSDFNLTTSVEGNGTVVRQDPKAGTKINQKMPIKLVCKPS